MNTYFTFQRQYLSIVLHTKVRSYLGTFDVGKKMGRFHLYREKDGLLTPFVLYSDVLLVERAIDCQFSLTDEAAAMFG